jgi:hypothetical protein
VATPKQRNTNEVKKAIKEGRAPDAWKEKPAKLAQNDRDRALERSNTLAPKNSCTHLTFGFQLMESVYGKFRQIEIC